MSDVKEIPLPPAETGTPTEAAKSVLRGHGVFGTLTRLVAGLALAPYAIGLASLALPTAKHILTGAVRAEAT